MTTLRLILLISGLVFIAIIYFWDTLKQRKSQRKQTISQSTINQDISGIRISPSHDVEDDYSGVLSELNQTLAESKKAEENLMHDSIPMAEEQLVEIGKHHDSGPTAMPETQDMFANIDNKSPESNSSGKVLNKDIDEDNIITLYVTALPTMAFAGNDILDAINNVGLEYGEMNIFHHYGMGEMHSNQPLFSMADMFEPGNFDLDKLDDHHTRGLSLFLCLPVRVDAQVVFELMLNIAQRLAESLGGEIRGSDHKLINDEQIAEIRNKINLMTQA